MVQNLTFRSIDVWSYKIQNIVDMNKNIEKYRTIFGYILQVSLNEIIFKNVLMSS